MTTFTNAWVVNRLLPILDDIEDGNPVRARTRLHDMISYGSKSYENIDTYRALWKALEDVEIGDPDDGKVRIDDILRELKADLTDADLVDEAARQAAREACTGVTVRIRNDAPVDVTGDLLGAWVQAWVWVPIKKS